jgi:hypothetical protein
LIRAELERKGTPIGPNDAAVHARDVERSRVRFLVLLRRARRLLRIRGEH